MTGEYSLADIAAATGNSSSNDAWGNNGSWWIILFLIFAMFGWGGNGRGFMGGGNSGAADNYVLASDFATIQRQLSDGFGGVEKGLDTIRSGLCDGFYTEAQLVNGVNMNIAQGNYNTLNAIQSNGYESRLATQGLQSAMQNCCCDIRQQIADTNYNIATQANGINRAIENGFAQTNYNMASQNCQTLQAIDKVGDRVIDYLANKENQNLRDENFALRLAASQERQNNYLVSRLDPNPCPVNAYVVQPPQQVTFPVNCGGVASYGNNCGCGVQ